jgi:hypothetical protein
MSTVSYSPKHGVNPTQLWCFFCNKACGIALCGRLKGDAEAPRRVVNPGPCDECKELMKQGIIFISVNESLTENPKDPYRSGGWCVLREDAVRRMPLDDEVKNKILEARMSFMSDEVWDAFGLPRGKEQT